MSSCGLCREDRPLQRSHLLPSALYRMTRDASLKNPNPVIITKEITKTSSEQVTDYFLCRECEKRLNDGGERYTMSQVYDGKSFPLLDNLSSVQPYHTFPAT